MGPLYHQALEFVIDNASIFENDLVARELGILAVRLVGMSGYRDALYSLWEYFTAVEERSIRIEVLNAIGSLAPVDPRLVNNLNRWLDGENDRLRVDEEVDLEVIEEAIVALGKIGDDSSFPVLFSASILGGSDDIDEKAIEALYSIEGNFQDLILRVVEENPLTEKLEALRIGLSNEDINENEKGEIAELALSKGLYTAAGQSQEREILRQIRYESVRALTKYSWSTATNDVIEHFDQTLQEAILGIGRTSHVLEAIGALGAMNTHEAAVRLSLYLDLLNSDVERGKSVEDEIVLAVIQSLGELGDKVAFDYLLYARLLDYSDSIKKAAQDSLNQLNRL
jgi:HEAT repeat protein